MSSPKIFTADLREMVERFDPRYVAFCRKSEKFRYPMVRLGDLLSALPEYGAGEAGIERTDIKQPRYIRITDIGDDGELSPELGVTAETIEARYFLSDGNLLFARSGATVGKCYLHETSKVEYPCFYAGYMIRFRFNATVLPKYVFAFAQTAYYRDWVTAIQRSAGQPNINAQEYCDLPIPLPPSDVQKQIVAELDAAYAAKRKADAKAAELLNSIDRVVLNALGIPPIPPPDTSLPARIFTVSSHDVTDRSFAPSHYLPKLDFSPARYKCISFCETVSVDPLELVVNAKRPYHLVPMDAVSAEYGCIERTEEIPSDVMTGYTTFRNGDVIFAKISPCMENGKSAVVSVDIDGVVFGSTEFLVFRPNKDMIIADYLHLLLRLKALREYAERNMSGTTGHQRVTKSFFWNLKIPVPPISEQEEIVDKVSAIRAEAKTLKASAAAALAVSKKIIESILMEENKK